MHVISVFCWVFGILSAATVVGTLVDWVLPFDAVRDGWDHVKRLILVEAAAGVAVVECMAGFMLWRAA
jgi:hypothetical protein